MITSFAVVRFPSSYGSSPRQIMEVWEPRYSPAHSCKHCQRIVLCREHFLGDTFRIRLPHTGAEVRQAMKDGCVLMMSLLGPERHLRVYDGNLDQWMRTRHGSWLENGPCDGEWYLDIYSRNFERPPRQDVTLSIQYEDHYGQYPNDEWSARPSLGIAADEVPDSVERALDPHVGSDDSLRQAREWLDICHDTHPLCDKATQDFVPTRLLKLGMDDEREIVRLIDTSQEQFVFWAALSYVWGGDQILKTTVSSTTERNEQMAISEFPQTLQDAFTVCKAIGIQHLWVDCLCIVQDDEEDLARELEAMPKIYQNAWVTISASTADNVSRGFLEDRGYATDFYGGIVSLPYISTDGNSSGSIVLCGGLVPNGHDDTAPIHQRAWTYQERRMSPRVLDFNKATLSFICRTGRFRRGHSSELWTLRKADVSSSTWAGQERVLPCTGNHELPNWHAIVGDYATRKLTFPNDKLRAIAALAELYSIRTKQTYVAGLWMETLIVGLCWYLRDDPGGSGLAPRPREYRAPSWSWAAIDVEATRPLQFLTNLEFDSVFGRQGDSASGDRGLNPEAMLVHLILEQTPPNTTYGRIQSASLTLEGLALNTKWSFDEGYQILQDIYMFTTRDAKEDMVPTTKGEWPVTAFVLVRGTEGIQMLEIFVFGLLLVEEASEQYRRVGTFRIWLRPARHDINKIFQRRHITII